MQTTVRKCCYFCVDETACLKCGIFYHPLETEYCTNKKCNRRTLSHRLYVLPKECENTECLFHQLAQAALMGSCKDEIIKK